MDLWGRKEAEHQDVHEYRKQQDITGVGESLDALAISIADETMPRRRALRLLGAALVGSVMASIPGVAWAKPCKPGTLKCGTKCCPKEASCVRGECVCPGGTTGGTTTPLCGSGASAKCCASNQGCVNGSCLDFCPPETETCCCTCFYNSLTGGPPVSGCQGDVGSFEECLQVCSTVAPPPGTVFMGGAAARCGNPSETSRYICGPAFEGGIGTNCTGEQECAPPPA
jgi:hypothetical protein